MTPICETNRGKFGHKILGYNKYGKENFRSWKRLTRHENIYRYFKTEKCYTEIWTEILKSKTRSKDLKTQKVAIKLYIKGSRSNLQSH